MPSRTLPRVQLVSKMLGKELDDLSDIKGEQPSGTEERRTEPPYLRPKICAAMPESSPLTSILRRARSMDLRDCWDLAEASASALFSVLIVSSAVR